MRTEHKPVEWCCLGQDREKVIGSVGEVECGRAGRMWKKGGFGQQHEILLTFLKRKESKSLWVW